MHSAARASAAASATGASAATRTAARRNASSWYSSSRPVRARLDASDDGEVRQRRHASWFSATPTGLARGDVELRLFGSLATSSRLHTSTTEQWMHSKRLEALSDVPSSSDRFDSVTQKSTALFELNCRTAQFARKRFSSTKLARRRELYRNQLRTHFLAGAPATNRRNTIVQLIR